MPQTPIESDPMRIDRLTLRHFKCFEERTFQFHPQFNLVVGTNGTGKTSVLDGLAVAIGSWLLGILGEDSRHIRPSDVMLASPQKGEWVRRFPCEVEARGEVQGQRLHWQRALKSPDGRTTTQAASAIKQLAALADAAVRQGQSVELPLISYYGTGRLWQEPREKYQVTDPLQAAAREDQSRLMGYTNSVDPRLSVGQLTRWIARQAWIAFQQGQPTPAWKAVQPALLSCMEEASDIYFDAVSGEVVVRLAQGRQPFSNLSDGQRCMLALVGDIAQKAARLNPHLGAEVLRQTRGVVLIDELDLHLHPRWQRRVIEDLRRTFPLIQFICTTHSPFLIQALHSSEELMMLEGQPSGELGQLGIEDIAHTIQGIDRPEVSQRYDQMRAAARQYLETLEQAALAPQEQLAAYRERLAASIAPFADNPAFQAFLEMRRAARLGA